ncbi:MAG: RNA 3'-terminal phosphate cyclase [Tahibacter sp.]
MDQLEIDAAAGGGQLLRTALALSLCTGTAFEMRGIRAQRSRPGLMRQHLTAVAAAVKIGNASVEGAAPGATTIRFAPGKIMPGTYHFSIGTAGSAPLVLQTILPALWTAQQTSEITLEGGTHNPLAPSADFLADTYLPTLARMGVSARLQLERHGFFPAGGGRLVATVEPCAALQPLSALEAASSVSITATALISALSEEIGQRELHEVARRLQLDASALTLHRVENAFGPGNALVIRVQRGDHVETFTGFGERGISSERVAEHLCREVRDYLAAGAPIGPHLADQLLIPAALAGGGEFITTTPTDHLMTNAALIEKFLAVDIEWKKLDERRWQVSVRA